MNNLEKIIDFIGILTMTTGLLEILLRINYLRNNENNKIVSPFRFVFGFWFPLKTNEDENEIQIRQKKMMNQLLILFYILFVFGFMLLFIYKVD